MTFTSFTDVLDGRKNLCTLLTLEGLFCLLIKLDYNKVTYWHCNWLIGHLENFPTILLKVDGFIVSWWPGNLGWTSKADMVLMLVLLWSPLPLLPVGEELEVSLASLTKSFFARMHGRNIFFFKLGKEQFVSYNSPIYDERQNSVSSCQSSCKFLNRLVKTKPNNIWEVGAPFYS